jgi:arylsulfatase A-like enzyme
MLRKTTTLTVLLLAATSLSAQRPNVVLIIGDDQAFGDYGFMGHETIRTPNLDRLSKEGALFTRGYVPTALCRPSLASLATGRWPHRHGVTGNDPKRGTNRQRMVDLFKKSPTVASILGEIGYRSLQTGKWWEGNHKVGGFTHGMTHGDTKRRGRHGDLGLQIGRKGLKEIFDFIAEGKKDEPFFVWYAPFLPHTPHNPPARLLKKYAKKGRSKFVAKYYAMCEWFDETCGQLLDHLLEKDLEKNTVVLFVSDNGWIQKKEKRGFAPRSKRSPYEGGVRTPIIVKWPGKVPVGRHDMPVSSIDLVPTMLRACGADVPKTADGVDLLPLCRGEVKKRGPIFGAAFTHDIVELGRPERSLVARFVVHGRWKLVWHATAKSKIELFDVVADPHETKDLAGENGEQVKQLRAKVDGWWAVD